MIAKFITDQNNIPTDFCKCELCGKSNIPQAILQLHLRECRFEKGMHIYNFNVGIIHYIIFTEREQCELQEVAMRSTIKVRITKQQYCY